MVKPHKQSAQDRQKAIRRAQEEKAARKAKGQDSRKVHDTKGKNTHARSSNLGRGRG